MIDVLLLVDLGRTSASSVQSEQQTVSVAWPISKPKPLEEHGLAIKSYASLLNHSEVEVSQFSLFFTPLFGDLQIT